MTKSRGKVKEPGKLLTEVENELMQILWKLGEGSVGDVLAELPPVRKLAYTSVSTIMRILEQKGVLSTRKEGRGHVYIPMLRKEQYEALTVRHVVDKVFAGTPMALVKQLLSTADLSPNELGEIRRLIRKKEEEV